MLPTLPKIGTRIAVSVSYPMRQAIAKFMVENNITVISAAVRAILTSAMSKPHDAAFASAYEQTLSDLRFYSRWILKEVVARMEDAPKGMYGGRGAYRLPLAHRGGVVVPRGGSSCSNCRFLGNDGVSCMERNFQEWNGGLKLPAPADQFCSDWWEPK